MEHADEEATTSQIEQNIDYKTPKKTSSLIESEALLAKINILTTRPENQSQNAKVKSVIFFTVSVHAHHVFNPLLWRRPLPTHEDLYRCI